MVGGTGSEGPSDKCELRTGNRLVKKLGEALAESDCCLVMIGKNGIAQSRKALYDFTARVKFIGFRAFRYEINLRGRSLLRFYLYIRVGVFDIAYGAENAFLKKAVIPNFKSIGYRKPSRVGD